MRSLNQTYLPVLPYHFHLLKSFAINLSELCPPSHPTATFSLMMKIERDSMSLTLKSNFNLPNCLILIPFLTALQESQYTPFIITVIWNSTWYLHPLYCIHSNQVSRFPPKALIPLYYSPPMLSRVIIWSIQLASAVKSHRFWPSASSETGLNLLVIMFRMIFSTSD